MVSAFFAFLMYDFMLATAGKCLNRGNWACGMAHLGWRLGFGIVVNGTPGGVC